MGVETKPRKPKKKVKIADYTGLDLGEWQVFSKNSYIITNWGSFVFLVLILIMYGCFNAIFTYQTPGDSTCTLVYGLDINFWIFFAYAVVNILNARESVVVNEKMW